MSRRKSRDCECDPLPRREDCRQRRCRWGYCEEWQCRRCRKIAWGFGPLGCKCDFPRKLYYPGMARKKPVPVKRNAMRKRKRSARNW
jgi:hypothetical protein